jgi:hypothetical protein
VRLVWKYSLFRSFLDIGICTCMDGAQAIAVHARNLGKKFQALTISVQLNHDVNKLGRKQDSQCFARIIGTGCIGRQVDVFLHAMMPSHPIHCTISRSQFCVSGGSR